MRKRGLSLPWVNAIVSRGTKNMQKGNDDMQIAHWYSGLALNAQISIQMWTTDTRKQIGCLVRQETTLVFLNFPLDYILQILLWCWFLSLYLWFSHSICDFLFSLGYSFLFLDFSYRFFSLLHFAFVSGCPWCLSNLI